MMDTWEFGADKLLHCRSTQIVKSDGQLAAVGEIGEMWFKVSEAVR
jgi:hypothetical protein